MQEWDGRKPASLNTELSVKFSVAEITPDTSLALQELSVSHYTLGLETKLSAQMLGKKKGIPLTFTSLSLSLSLFVSLSILSSIQ